MKQSTCKNCNKPIRFLRGVWIHDDPDEDPNAEDYGWLSCNSDNLVAEPTKPARKKNTMKVSITELEIDEQWDTAIILTKRPFTFDEAESIANRVDLYKDANPSWYKKDINYLLTECIYEPYKEIVIKPQASNSIYTYGKLRGCLI